MCGAAGEERATLVAGGYAAGAIAEDVESEVTVAGTILVIRFKAAGRRRGAETF